MSHRSALVARTCAQAAWVAGVLLPLPSAAQAPAHGGGKNASAGFSVNLTVRPAFRILQVTPVPGGHTYRVWTNLKAVQLNGREYRFERVGEATLMVPGGPIEAPVLQQDS